jgi:PadR family transcriptional regulator PadR
MTAPNGRHWGYDLSKKSGVKPGSLYPILQRMLDENWLSAGWQDPNEAATGRPRRRYYKLTAEGLAQLGGLAEGIKLEPLPQSAHAGSPVPSLEGQVAWAN